MTQEQQHPITPPPELVRQWIPAGWDCSPNTFTTLLMRIADNAAQWGADQRGTINEAELQKARDEELEAIMHWLVTGPYAFSVLGRSHNNLVHDLRAARHPKPPTLKEQALQLLERYDTSGLMLAADQVTTIRRAIEALND
jgi:hypothetical protein